MCLFFVMILHQGDCLDILKTLQNDSIDSLVTDPPAGIGFMGTEWDHHKGGRQEWVKWMADVMRECYRVLKPGAHGLVWAIPRTSHWTATALEDAGFEVRDTILHCFGQGFPKSLNINKALEKDGKICACENKIWDEKNTSLYGVQSFIQSKNKQAIEIPEDVQLSMQRCNATLEPGVCCAPSEDCTKYERPERDAKIRSCQSSMERRNHIQTEQGQLHQPEVHPMSEGFPSDGAQGRLYHGTPLSNGDAYGALSDASGGGASQRPQHAKQSHLESGMVSRQSGTQTCGSCGKAQVAEGLGTALKPAVEIWWLVRKPISEKTVAANVLKWGTGGINIDGCRIESGADYHELKVTQGGSDRGTPLAPPGVVPREFKPAQGRFPANLVLSHSELCEDDQCDMFCPVLMLDKQSGITKSTGGDGYKNSMFAGGKKTGGHGLGDVGGASRFFYCAKISTRERNAGLEDMPDKEGGIKNSSGRGFSESDPHKVILTKNNHPTVKSKKLMSYLCKLITPPNGVVLDPFMGSGSTGIAAKECGFDFVGIEKEAEYFEIAQKRIDSVKSP